MFSKNMKQTRTKWKKIVKKAQATSLAPMLVMKTDSRNRNKLELTLPAGMVLMSKRMMTSFPMKCQMSIQKISPRMLTKTLTWK